MNTSTAEIIQDISRSLVFVCFLFSFVKIDFGKREHRLLFLILSIDCLTELLARFSNITPQSQPIFVSFALASHQLLWILFIVQNLPTARRLTILAVCILFAGLDFFVIEGQKETNCYTVPFTSLVYLAIFCQFCFDWTNSEDVSVFNSNKFLLLCAPLLFFFGMSALLAFKNPTLSRLPFGKLSLYNIVNFSGNIMYYSLVFIYLLRQKRQKND